ncbi:MAG: hypothetical protein AB7O50_12255 [Pseudolabrys sp.]
MPFVIPPLVKWALVAVGGAMAVHWVVREVRRINEELEREKALKAQIPKYRPLPTLRRDPATGEYRL